MTDLFETKLVSADSSIVEKSASHVVDDGQRDDVLKGQHRVHGFHQKDQNLKGNKIRIRIYKTIVFLQCVEIN